MLNTAFSVDPPTEVIRAGYHCPSVEFLARHSSPADQVCLYGVCAFFRGASFADDAAAASDWAIADCVSSMRDLSSSRSEARSSLSGSEERANSTCESWSWYASRSDLSMFLDEGGP